jgi:transcriptional regulator with XRE-family HTH domain
MARKNIAKLKDLAIRVGCSPRSLSSWLSGTHLPSAFFLGRLSQVLGTDAGRFLGTQQAPPTISRREFVAGLITLPAVLTYQPRATGVASPEVLSSLSAITQQYRTMQRNGLGAIEDGLRGHGATIQQALEVTVDDRKRRELWRILAKAQLPARLNVTSEHELGRGKTWNEAAIASAQQSSDTELLAAAIGHYAHLYLLWQHDAVTAGSIMREACERTARGSPLSGWLSLVSAAIAAKTGDRARCEADILEAEEVAHTWLRTREEGDVFFTDFTAESVDVFGGNSLLVVGQPAKAYKRLTATDVGRLAVNRHATTFADIAKAYAAAGELDAAQVYALQAVDSASATGHLYVVPDLLALANELRLGNPREPHAAAIVEYAQLALQHR